MRKDFAAFLHQVMLVDSRVFLVIADLGYKLWDDIKRDFPERFINIGAAEQVGMGICVGLALEGKIPIFYSITPFAIYRPFETIRNYLSNEQVPVKIVSSGRDKDYAYEGFSHWATEVKPVLSHLQIEQYYPQDTGMFKDDMNEVFRKFIYNGKPSYLNLVK